MPLMKGYEGDVGSKTTCQLKQKDLRIENIRIGVAAGAQKRKVVNAKKIFCQLAVKKMDYQGAEVACYLGVITSSVNRLAVSEEAADLKKYL